MVVYDCNSGQPLAGCTVTSGTVNSGRMCLVHCASNAGQRLVDCTVASGAVNSGRMY